MNTPLYKHRVRFIKYLEQKGLTVVITEEPLENIPYKDTTVYINYEQKALLVDNGITIFNHMSFEYDKIKNDGSYISIVLLFNKSVKSTRNIPKAKAEKTGLKHKKRGSKYHFFIEEEIDKLRRKPV